MSRPVSKVLAAAVLGAVVGAGALAAPAQAGGPGQVYVFGASQSECKANLDHEVLLYRHNGYTVTGVNACRWTGSRWFGDFVANP